MWGFFGFTKGWNVLQDFALHTRDPFKTFGLAFTQT